MQQVKTKKPAGEDTQQAQSLTTPHSTPSAQNCQSSDSDTQLFQSDGKYQPPADQNKARHFAFIVYEESAPANWRDQMDATGLPWACSPHHDSDTNPDGSPKKPHYHCIVSYPNTTTYNAVATSIRAITHGPYPQIIKSVSGAYAYFTHKWNPEKYQYDSKDIQVRNGWTKVLESVDVMQIILDITKMIFRDDYREYSELTATLLGEHNMDAFQVVSNHTTYFNGVLTSYRNAPERALKRLYNATDDEELKQIIDERLQFIESEDK